MLEMAKLKGIFPAMYTPFTASGQVDRQGLQRLVKYLLDSDVSGLFILGSSGEFPALFPDEREEIIGIVADEVRGRVPLLVGTSGESTRKAIAHTKIAGRAGADVAVVLPPYYFGSTQQEIISHYRALLGNAIPIMIYNNPFSAKVRIDLRTLETLAAEDGVIAIKDSTGDFGLHQQLVQTFQGSRVKIFQGDERLAAASFLIGADGGTLALASVAPRLFVDMYEAAQAGDLSRVTGLQRKASDLLKIFEVTGTDDGAFFAGGKVALMLLGICEATVSAPFDPPTTEVVSKVETLLRQHDLL